MKSLKLHLIRFFFAPSFLHKIMILVCFAAAAEFSCIHETQAFQAISIMGPGLQSPLPDIRVVKGTIKKGDTISSILDRYMPLKSIYSLDRKSEEIFPLRKIRLGQPYKITLQKDQFLEFEYRIDQEEKLVITKNKDGFSVFQDDIVYDVSAEVVSATIHYSLFESVRQAGESSELAFRLSDIFAWDIDFLRDIQPGDQFRVLVEKRFHEGRFSGYGKIKAAFFNNSGTVYKAFLYTDKNGSSGYYDEDGNSLQRSFLKAPLTFSRISSKFTQKRLHPIFKEYRAHPGVDYAAPQGTPIKTVGDGIVTSMGYNKGMGNYINIRHFNGYETGYNHMCRFAGGIKKNKKVLQGDVIGYVGMTGYATGPHLDFRMKKNGRLIDPLKHKSPSTKPVSPKEMETFLARTDELTKQIMGSQQLALNTK